MAPDPEADPHMVLEVTTERVDTLAFLKSGRTGNLAIPDPLRPDWALSKASELEHRIAWAWLMENPR